MKPKKLSRDEILKFEKAVDDGVYVAPSKISAKQEMETKKLIEKMKNAKNRQDT
ncbi:hypothetical protein [Heliorestis acidaminivorans]|uniref:hypothetical protein n=1 Tax=Heliorestis acidaminivorans TaxID=553427 RepID=UPI001479632A|nr:hypothetical protein [Heliorestis acidaminivorans]